MPQKHKYKCLSPNHFEVYDKHARERTNIFIAMNNPTPECPLCRGIKLEDWGEVPHYEPMGLLRTKQASFGKSGASKRIDKTLAGLAESFGLTDIKNSGGQATKAAKEPGKGEFGTMKIAGVDVPIDKEIRGSWGKGPYAPLSVPTRGKFPGRRSIPTQVVAKHDGR